MKSKFSYIILWIISHIFVLSGCAVDPKLYGARGLGSVGKESSGNFGGGVVQGRVATFGETPTAVKRVDPKSLAPPPELPDTPSAVTKGPPPVLPDLKSETTNLLPSLPLKDIPGSDKIINITEYDFSVKSIKDVPPAYLPSNSASSYDITAFNNGYAPVTVIVNIDNNSVQNLSTDKPLPLKAVVLPKSQQILVRFGSKIKSQSYSYRSSHTWSIGDYTARHHCTEHYRFPFGNNVRAFASVNEDAADATPYTRNAVIFSMPSGTPIFAARKGMVVNIKNNNKLDILHEDSTIATYSHLDKIDPSLFLGKVVTTDDVIGIAGTSEKPKDAFIQLTVWRPETRSPIGLLKTNEEIPGFELVSFPLEFCSVNSKECKVLKRNQPVFRQANQR